MFSIRKIMTWRISLIIKSFFSNHFLHSGDCNVRFGDDIVRRIQMLVTLRNQRVERKSTHLNSGTDLKLLIIIISADPDCCAQLSKHSRFLPALDVLWIILDLLPVLHCQSDSLSTLVILSVSTLRTSFEIFFYSASFVWFCLDSQLCFACLKLS